MSDQTTALPAAGWYGDPSDAANERWWGGLEWTEHTRALDVAPPVVAAPQFPPPASPAPALQPPPPASAFDAGAAATTADPAIPQFASQTTADVPQFASQTTADVPQFASQEPASPFAASPFADSPFADSPFAAASATSTGSPWDTAGTSDPFSFGTTAQPYVAQPAPTWNTSQSYPDEPQTNPLAIVGFVLSLLGFTIVSLVISILGAKKATRLENAGGTPVGRGFARWGIGLSIAGTVGGLIGLGIFGYSLYLAGTLGAFDNVGVDTGSGTSTSETTEASTDSAGELDPAVPGENPVADEIAEGMAGSMDFFYGTEARSVTCPADATDAPGTVVSCNIVLVDGRELRGEQTFTADGSSTQYFDK